MRHQVPCPVRLQSSTFNQRVTNTNGPPVRFETFQLFYGQLVKNLPEHTTGTSQAMICLIMSSTRTNCIQPRRYDVPRFSWFPSCKGYESIESGSGAAVRWEKLLKTPSSVSMDSRIAGSLGRPQLPVHVMGRFILKKLVEHPGALIDCSMLCARLGIDEDSFAPSRIENDFRKFSYKGPFRLGHDGGGPGLIVGGEK